MTSKSTPSKPSVTTPRGREARTGEFITVKEALRRPSTTVVEQIPKPGHKPK